MRNKGRTEHKKKKEKDYLQDGGAGLVVVVVGVLADLSNTTDAQVRGLRGGACVWVCVLTRVGLCVLFKAQLCSPTQSAAGMIAFDPPAPTDIPSELLRNCLHLSSPKETP